MRLQSPRAGALDGRSASSAAERDARDEQARERERAAGEVLPRRADADEGRRPQDHGHERGRERERLRATLRPARSSVTVTGATL